jgi:hypothetical protein
MVSESRYSGTRRPHEKVPADILGQVEPDRTGKFVSRPYSLTPAEMKGLTATIASEPLHVLAWVRYPASADLVRGVALAWTPRTVYVEWEDRGTHRAWVWASAVQRPPTNQAAAAPGQPREATTTAPPTLRTEHLVRLVNAQLARIGSEFVTAMSKPTGPFGAVVFGVIEAHHVRLDFSTDTATGMCTVLLLSRTEPLTERSEARTLEEAIDAYPWAVALDALMLTDDSPS